MPYVAPSVREHIDKEIEALVTRLIEIDWDSGAINYAFSRIVWTWFKRRRRYATIKDILGTLDAVSKEFYRRRAVGYEAEKIDENGDLEEV
jgi:hypothetical protein